MRPVPGTEVLIVSLGSTAGLRASDGELAASIVLSKVDLRRYARGFGADTNLARPYVGYHAPSKVRA